VSTAPDFFEDAEVAVTRRALARARSGPPRVPYRVVLIVVLVTALVGGELVDHLVHRPVPARTPTPLDAIAPTDVESSAWYCAGGTSATGSTAQVSLQLLNTTGHPVQVTLSAVSSAGERASEAVTVPARDQIAEVPGALVKGAFVAATVEVAGGGILVAETVDGPLGWSTTSCSRSTATSWYFAAGSTVNGGTLAVSLYNPTTTVAVVDMTFATPSGVEQPQPFEGIVVAPGSLAVEQIDRYVQDASSVSTIVSARTGSVVAAALQTVSSGGSQGLSVRLGVPTPARVWTVPRAIDLTGGLTVLSIFNPTTQNERVVVTVRPFHSPVATFSEVVAPTTTWVLETTGVNRIPDGIPFVARVRVAGRGSGVIVDQSEDAPRSFGGPQFGAATALRASSGARTEVLPSPGTGADPAVPGAGVATLDLLNPGAHHLMARVWALRGTGLVPVAAVRVAAGGTLSLAATASTGVERAIELGQLGRVALMVRATSPVLVVENLAPAATVGVVSLTAARA
jgi:hypothetical protein